MARFIPELKLKYPEWEQQDSEKNEHKEAFDCFVAHGGSIRQCAKDLQGCQRGDIFHGITLKYKPYSEPYFCQLATANKFDSRRELKDKFDLEVRNRQFDKIEFETVLEDFENTHEAERDTLGLLADRVSSGEINGTQTKDFVTALNGLRDYKRKLRGEDDSKKLIVDAEIDAKTEVKTDLQKDIQAYQEKLMNSSLSDRVKNKFRTISDD